jgi:hypothetical protein
MESDLPKERQNAECINKTYFVASDVASLIKKHKYRSSYRTLLYAANDPQNKRSREMVSQLLKNDNPVVKKAFQILHKEKNALRELREVQEAVKKAAELKKFKLEQEEVERLAREAANKAIALEQEAKKAKEQAQKEAAKAKEIELKKKQVAQEEAKKRAEQIIIEAATKPLKDNNNQNINLSQPKTLHEATKLAKAFVNTNNIKEICNGLSLDNSKTNLLPGEEVIVNEVKLFVKPEIIVKAAAQANKDSIENSNKEIKLCNDSVLKNTKDSEKCNARAETLALIAEPQKMDQIIQDMVQKKRGRDEEKEVLDEAEKRHCQEIQHRNTELGSLESTYFKICGKVDGLMDNSIVEVKTRKNWFYDSPPIYDIIQLRVYLKMFDKPEGLLIEENKALEKRRETIVKNCKEEWDKIESSLNESALKIVYITENDIIEWSKEICTEEERQFKK